LAAAATALLGSAFTIAACFGAGFAFFPKLPLARSIRFALGAALLSTAVFLLLLAGAGGRLPFAVLGAGAIAAGAFLKGRISKRESTPWPLAAKAGAALLLGAYGASYLVHAMAPETAPDAITYHLGLVAEALRLSRFPNRTGFFEMLPRGAGMLFAHAFAFGAHSAAKLVHFAFLVLTFPLLLRVGGKLGLHWSVPAAAALVYVLTPVVAVSSTSAYNDAALVFCVLAVFYLLLCWREAGDWRLLVCAGLIAGFCYAIKPTGAVVPAAGLVWIAIAARSWRSTLVFTAAAVLMCAPWALRSAVLTGNPIAPLGNRLFPNPHFHITTEDRLSATLREYGGVTAAAIPLEITIRGSKLQGLLGPIYLLAPIGLLAMRRKNGLNLAAAALVTAAPWLLNIGTRFLMPALPFLLLLLFMALPHRALVSVVLAHALLSWPAAVSSYADPAAWTLRGFPLKAAFRITPEREYLRERVGGFALAEALHGMTAPGERVLDLFGIPWAYSHFVPVGPWHSATGDRLSAALQLAAHPAALDVIVAEWPEQRISGVRFRVGQSFERVWAIQEIQLRNGSRILRPVRSWFFSANPNPWEILFAFDRNVASAWQSWEHMGPGMFVEIELAEPQRATGATMLVVRSDANRAIEVDLRTPGAAWQRAQQRLETRPPVDLTAAALALVRSSNIRYIVVQAGGGGEAGSLGRRLFERTRSGELDLMASERELRILRVR